MGPMPSQITSLSIVCPTVYSGADQRKHQNSASLAFVRWILRWPVNSPLPILWFPGTSFITNGTMFTLLLAVLYHMYMWIHLQTDAIVHTLIARQGEICETGFAINHTPSTTKKCLKNLVHNTWNAVVAHIAHCPQYEIGVKQTSPYFILKWLIYAYMRLDMRCAPNDMRVHIHITYCKARHINSHKKEYVHIFLITSCAFARKWCLTFTTC